MRILMLEIDDPWYDRLMLFIEGIYFVRTGSLDKAQQKAYEIKKLVEEGLHKNEIRKFYGLMGGIEHQRGNFYKAAEFWEKGMVLLPAEADNDRNTTISFCRGLADAYFAAGELEKAQRVYEKILRMTYGRQYVGIFYARSFYMLGLIFEKKGNRAKAIKHYEKFLDLWKDADPGIAEVDDAKKRLAGLKNQ
jgi:tetratricopeptide (TPR) repeat protein